jgi:hypothetical protein
MKYLFALLSVVAAWFFTSFVAMIFGRLAPIILGVLGYYLAVNNVLIGCGVLIGSIMNRFFTGMYLRREGAMSNQPRNSRVSSTAYIWLFSFCAVLIYAFGFDIGMRNQWLVIGFVILGSIVVMYNAGLLRSSSLKSIQEAVSEYAIVEKYDDGFRWAIYLYMKNGAEGWNQTIEGSFMARDPEKDLTFVFRTEEEALNHAEHIFPDAQHVEFDVDEL